MRRDEVILRAMQRTFSFLVLVLASCAVVPAADGGARDASRDTGASVNPIRGEDHYVMRDGLRIYLWEKHKAGWKAPSRTTARSHSSSMEARGRVAHSSTCRFATIR